MKLEVNAMKSTKSAGRYSIFVLLFCAVMLVAGGTNANAAGSISGKVRDVYQNVIPGVMLIAWDYYTGEWVSSVESGADGAYTITGLAPGLYQVYAYAYNIYTGNKIYASQWHDSTYSSELAKNILVQEGLTTQDINFSLAPGGAFAGVAVKSGTQVPVPSLLISVWDFMSETYVAEGMTGIDGVYVVNGLVPGQKYRVCAEAAGTGYAFECYNDTFFDSATPVTVEAGLDKLKTGINFALAPGGNVSGVVTQEGTPNLVADIQIHAIELVSGYWAGYGVTGADGTYTVSGLAPGRYWIYASASGTNYLSEYYNNTLDYNAAAAVNVLADQTTPGIDFALAPAGGISGVVSKAGTTPTQYIKGLKVVAYDFSSDEVAGSAWTDSVGAYAIEGLAPGQYRLRVFNSAGTPEYNYVSEWYDNAQQREDAASVTVVAGVTTTDKNFSLAAGSNITGRVIQDLTSIEVMNIFVYAYNYDTDELAGFSLTNDKGNYNISGLAPGKYRVQASLTNGRYVSEWYNNVQLRNSATAVNVAAGASTDNINFSVTIYPLTIVTTSPTGLQVVVDGKTYTSPYAFGWRAGSSHTINVTSPQTKADGTDRQFVYRNWSDGKAKSHTVIAARMQDEIAVFMANFDRMIGDVDGNHLVDIRDAVMFLQVVAGVNPGVSKSAALFYGDKIGIPEVIYILQRVAGVRQQ